MEIQSSTLSLYANSGYAFQQNQASHAQEKTNQTQQQSNQQITASEASEKSNTETNTQNKNKPLLEGKTAIQAEQTLDEAELKQVTELKRRDTEVRAHEAAHLAAAGRYATSGASFEYKRGPDGKSYAVGGEVGIDTSPIPNDPQATLRKAQQIRAAANAPANPSAQDRQVAVQASVMATEARVEIRQETIESQSSQVKPDIKKDADANEATSTTNNESQKASNEYQAVASYTEKAEDVITSLLQQIA